MKKFLLTLSSILIIGCGDCFEGVQTHGSLSERDKQIINTTLEAIPNTLNQTINCTNIHIFYNIEKFYQKVEELNAAYKAFGVCKCNKGSGECSIYMYSWKDRETFTWILIHELLHTLGVKHGPKMDEMCEQVYDAIEW